MAKQRIGRGPLDVALEDTATSQPRMYVRDGSGLVMVLPVHVDSLRDVRAHLDSPGGDEVCDVELVDERGQVASRWGSFAHPGDAAALAVVLLGSDRAWSTPAWWRTPVSVAGRRWRRCAGTGCRSYPPPSGADLR